MEEIAKWYKYDKTNKHYFKTSKRFIPGNNVSALEDILERKYRDNSTTWSTTKDTTLADLSEIIQFLPKNHPDRNIKIIHEIW